MPQGSGKSRLQRSSGALESALLGYRL